MSEPVEKEGYLLIVLRYIHQNPVKAGIVNKVEDYKWSSYKEYYNDYSGQKSFISTDLIKDYFKTFKDFLNYMNASNNDECLEYKLIKRYNDNTLREIIQKKYEVNNINRMSIKERKKYIMK